MDWFNDARGSGGSVADLIARRKYARAIEALRAQFEGKSPDAKTRLQLADLLVLAGREQEAIPILVSLADEFSVDGFVAKAVAILKRVEKLEPSRADVEERLRFLIGRAYRAPAPPVRFAPPPPRFELGMEAEDEAPPLSLIVDPVPVEPLQEPTPASADAAGPDAATVAVFEVHEVPEIEPLTEAEAEVEAASVETIVASIVEPKPVVAPEAEVQAPVVPVVLLAPEENARPAVATRIRSILGRLLAARQTEPERPPVERPPVADEVPAVEPTPPPPAETSMEAEEPAIVVEAEESAVVVEAEQAVVVVEAEESAVVLEAEQAVVVVEAEEPVVVLEAAPDASVEPLLEPQAEVAPPPSEPPPEAHAEMSAAETETAPEPAEPEPPPIEPEPHAEHPSMGLRIKGLFGRLWAGRKEQAEAEPSHDPAKAEDSPEANEASGEFDLSHAATEPEAGGAALEPRAQSAAPDEPVASATGSEAPGEPMALETPGEPTPEPASLEAAPESPGAFAEATPDAPEPRPTIVAPSLAPVAPEATATEPSAQPDEPLATAAPESRAPTAAEQPEAEAPKVLAGGTPPEPEASAETPQAETPEAEEPQAEDPPMSEEVFHERLLDVIEDVLRDGAQKGARRPAPTDTRRRTDSPLLGELGEAERLELVHRLRLVTYEPGDIVLTEGEPGEMLYLLTTGVVKVFVRNPVSRNIEVCELKEGDFFGEVSILSGRPRTATITAAAPCELLELDRATLDALSRSHPGIVDTLEAYYIQRTQSPDNAAVRAAAVADTETQRRAAEVLRAHFGDRSWDPKMRLKLADVLLKAGKQQEALPVLVDLADAMARQGQPEKAIAILKKIERIEGRHTEQINLAPLERAARAPVALPPARSAPEKTSDFFQGWMVELVRDTVRRGLPSAQRSTRDGPSSAGLLMSPLFEDFSDGEIQSLIDGLRLLVFEPGDIVLTEGEPGSSVFVVTSGGVKIFVRNPEGHNTLVGELGEGDFFGEISTLSGRPRSATVSSAARTEVLELDQRTLEAICAAHPRVRDVLEEVYIQRAANPFAAMVRGITSS